MTELPIGTRVTYHDAPHPIPCALLGTVTSPTAEEIKLAKHYNWDPEQCAVVVQWTDEPWDRTWQHPSDLRILEQP